MVNGIRVDGSYEQGGSMYALRSKQQRIRLIRSGPPSPKSTAWPPTKARGSGRFSLPGHLMSWERHDELSSTDVYGWGLGKNK